MTRPTYYDLSSESACDDAGNPWRIDFPAWSDDRWPLTEGVQIHDWEPTVVAVYPPFGSPVDYPHVFPFGWTVLSERLRAVVEPLTLDEVQYFLFRLEASLGDGVIEGYFVANLLHMIDCLDVERTIASPGWAPDVPMLEIGDDCVEKPVLSRRRIGDHRIFRLRGDQRRVVVRGDLKDAIEKSGASGCIFAEIELSD